MQKTIKVKENKRRGIAKSPVFTIVGVILIIWSISRLFPILWGLNMALRDSTDVVFENPLVVSIFHNPSLDSFKRSFTAIATENATFIDMLINSLFFAIIPNLVAIFFTTAVGYVVCKYKKYKIMRHIYSLILLVQFIPLYGALSSQYKLFYNLGFINSYSIVLASFGLQFGNFLYMYAFFQGVSWSYAESAFIDGAGHWRTFLQIMFPQAFSSIAVIFLMAFIGSWNDFTTCMLYYADGLPTLSYGIYSFHERAKFDVDETGYAAACMLVCIPSVILFLIFQEKIMTSMVIGGLKG